MAKKYYGPYSSKSLSTNNFWGFNENDDTLLRFKMNDSVVEAIKSAFTSLQNPDTSIDWPLAPEQYPYPEEFTNTIDMYRDMFSNAEVIPYTYVLKTDILYGGPNQPAQAGYREFFRGYGSGETTLGITPVMSTVGYYDDNTTERLKIYDSNDSYTGSGSIYEITQSTFHKISGFEYDDELYPTFGFFTETTGNNKIKHDVYIGDKTYYYDISRGTDNPTSFISSRADGKKLQGSAGTTYQVPRLMKKTDATKLSFYISNQLFSSYNYMAESPATNASDFIRIENLNEMYGRGIIHKGMTDYMEIYGGYTIPYSLKAFNNSNDGSYSTSSQRPLITQVAKDGNENPSFFNSPSTLVFFVKTTMTYYNDDGTEDTTRDPVQYWAFNIQNLWKQSNLISQSRAMGSHSVYEPSSGSNTNGVTYNYMSLGIGRTTDFYIPFPLFMKTETDYFNNAEFFTSLNRHNDFQGAFEVPPMYAGLSTAFSNIADFEVFLRDGLGLDARTDYDLARKTNTTSWPELQPSPNVPNEPGSTNNNGGEPNPSIDPGGEGRVIENIPDGTDHTGTAFLNNAWALTVGNVKNLQAALTDNSIWTSISNFFKDNPSEGVLSVVRFPFNLENIGVTINDTNVTVLGDEVGNSMVGTPLPTTVRTKIDMGTITIKHPSNSYLDYSPFTKVTIYLPFFGYKDLDVNMVMGKTLHIYYDVDYGDGSGLAIIRLQESDGVSIPLYTFSGNIGTIIPITKSDGRERIQNNIKSILTTVSAGAATIATGGVAAPVMAGITGSAAVNSASSLMTKPSYSSQGVPDAQHTYAINDLRPFVIVEYPSTNIESNYGATKGYQTNLYKQLKNLSGFTVCDNLRLNGIECTDTELTEIKNILTTGVVL